VILEKIRDEFAQLTETIQEDYKEILGYNVKCTFENVEKLNEYTATLPAKYAGDKSYDEKLFQEEAHYGKLKYTLLHQIAESKFYMKEQVLKSRKFVVISTDCISTVQLIFRDGKIFLGVYFRSSHLDNLLPVDTTFLLNMVQETISYLESRINEPTFEDVAPALEMLKNAEVEVAFNFGSLHTY